MVGRLLVSPVGFEKWKVIEPAKEVKPTRLFLVHTDHEKAIKNTNDARAEFESRGVRVEDHQVKGAFNFVEWFQVFERIVDDAREAEVVVNITPSHGVALSMAAMVAALRSLPCVCYDREETRLHDVSPSVLFHLKTLETTDKRILRALASQDRTVTDAAKEAEISELTTASASLKRLHERGFLSRKEEGRTVTYGLRKGVKEFLSSIVS